MRFGSRRGFISICHKGDIVVSQDYGVAAMARHLNKKARRSSGKNHIKGPKKRTPEDDEHLSESFEGMIRMAIQNREGENNGKE